MRKMAVEEIYNVNIDMPSCALPASGAVLNLLHGRGVTIEIEVTRQELLELSSKISKELGFGPDEQYYVSRIKDEWHVIDSKRKPVGTLARYPFNNVAEQAELEWKAWRHAKALNEGLI